jgi:hypothetical protein|tara:strand:+ start:431 stop:619 length:189 start_codon:yes stop_codon:yes gene_type:complete
MKTLFIILLLIITACAQNNSLNNTINELNFDLNKNYSFDEYVSELLLINKNKSFPNINDIPK